MQQLDDDDDDESNVCLFSEFKFISRVQKVAKELKEPKIKSTAVTRSLSSS